MKSAELPERILAALGRATSQRPARAEAVRSSTDTDEATFAAAIEQLAAGRRLNCAWIQKAGDAAPWLAIWPTGLPAKNAAWTNGSHSALFVTHRPNDLYQAHAPRSTPPAAPEPSPEPETRTMETPRKKGQLQADFTQLLAGRDHAVTLSAAAKQLGCSVESLRHAARALVQKGEVESLDLAGVTAYMLAAPAARTDPVAAGLDAVAEAVAAMEPGGGGGGGGVFAGAAGGADAAPAREPEPAPLPQPLYHADDLRVTEIHAVAAAAPAAPAVPDAPQPEHVVRIALWDDGTLTIADGDDILQYGPDVTRRLALLLGVPGTTLPARQPMPPLPQLIGSPAVAGA